MPAPPLKTEISDTYPNPSNGVARLGFAKFYDYVVGLLGSTGNAAEARGALGLGNVNNTSDANKPVSTATQTALNLKAPLASPSFSDTVQSQSGFIWGGGGSAYGLVPTTYTVESGTLRANYIFQAAHGDTATMVAYHEPGVSSFMQMRIGTNVFRLRSDGVAQKPGGGSWADVSDARTKDDVEDWDAGLDMVLALRVRQWRYKAETGRDPTVTYRGLVAQEAEVVAPTMVRESKGAVGELVFDDLRELDPSDLPFILVNAVKTLSTRLDEALARIETLEAQS